MSEATLFTETSSCECSPGPDQFAYWARDGRLRCTNCNGVKRERVIRQLGLDPPER